MQMSAHIGGGVRDPLRHHARSSIAIDHRIIGHVDRLHSGRLKIGLAARHPGQRGHGMTVTAEWRVPVKLLLGIDEQHEPRPEIGG